MTSIGIYGCFGPGEGTGWVERERERGMEKRKLVSRWWWRRWRWGLSIGAPTEGHPAAPDTRCAASTTHSVERRGTAPRRAPCTTSGTGRGLRQHARPGAPGQQWYATPAASASRPLQSQLNQCECVALSERRKKRKKSERTMGRLPHPP